MDSPECCLPAVHGPGSGVPVPGPVTVAGVDPVIAARTVGGTAQRVGLGTHQGVDERRQHGAQQIGFGMVEVLGQELDRVNTMVRGHRVVLLRGTLVGLLKDHAVAASHHDATLNNGATPYTTSV